MKRLYNNHVIAAYFIFQPVIDIITGVMKAHFALPISCAMIIRFLFLVYAGIYVISKKDKRVYGYLAIWALYCLITLTGNYFLKDSFSIFKQGYNLFRMLYFPIVLLFFYLYMQENKAINTKVFRNMGLIVSISFLISVFTHTSYCSYDDFYPCIHKGYLGYFFSANEYGSVLIALLTYQIINFIKNKKLIDFLVLALLALFLSLLGTKTSIIGVIALLAGYPIYHFIASIFDRKRSYKTKYILPLLIILGLITFNIKRLPIYNNMLEIYEQSINTSLNKNPSISESEMQKEVNNALVFNGRSDFVAINKELYKNAGSFHKLFGLTDQGNYLNGILISHINERDIHDLYMFYGIIGLIIEFSLPIYLLYKFVRLFLRKPRMILNDEIILLGLSLLLLLAISYMAGHSLFHPAVAFYIAYIINNLLKKGQEIT